MTSSRVRRTYVLAVNVGDRITELDTPEGPFYEVVRRSEKSIRLRLDDGFETTLRVRPSDAVLVEVSA